MSIDPNAKEDPQIFPLQREKERRVPSLLPYPSNQSHQSIRNFKGIGENSGSNGNEEVSKHHLFATYPDDIHKTLVLIAKQQGLEVNQLVANIIIDHVQQEAPRLFQTVNFHITRVEGDINVFQMVFEEELRMLCSDVKRALDRKAPETYLEDLRGRIIATLKKNPNLTPTAAEEVKAALILLRETSKETLNK